MTQGSKIFKDAEGIPEVHVVGLGIISTCLIWFGWDRSRLLSLSSFSSWSLHVVATIIERKLRSTKVPLFTLPCCSIIPFSSEGWKKTYSQILLTFLSFYNSCLCSIIVFSPYFSHLPILFYNYVLCSIIKFAVIPFYSSGFYVHSSGVPERYTKWCKYKYIYVSNLQDSYNLHVARNYRTGSESAGNRDLEEYESTVFYRAFVLLILFYNSGNGCNMIYWVNHPFLNKPSQVPIFHGKHGNTIPVFPSCSQSNQHFLML
jgi:hypothetical protein